jgi:uncharacterized protein involved in cysteine biosynthesis
MPVLKYVVSLMNYVSLYNSKYSMACWGMKVEYLSRLLCILAAILIAVTSAFTIATLGMLNPANFIMAIYYLYK